MVCRLCLEDKKLCNSHVLPSFVFRSIAPVKGQHLMEVSADPKRKRRLRHTPPYEKLLCEKCEGTLSSYERYEKKVLFDDLPREPARSSKKVWLFSGIRYHDFKLFEMSILWRAGISSLEFFREVTLGPHEERLRGMIHREDPGEPHDYGCGFLGVNAFPEVMRTIVTDSIWPPARMRVSDHRCYLLNLCGLFWLFFASSHTDQIPCQEIFLSKEGDLRVYWDISGLHRYVRKVIEGLVEGERAR